MKRVKYKAMYMMVKPLNMWQNMANKNKYFEMTIKKR